MKVHDHSEQGARDGAESLEARIDALFDRELDASARHELARDLRAHPREAIGVVTTRRMLEELARPVDAPDFEAEILAAVDRRRRFLPSSLRRAVTFGRLAAVVGFAALVTAMVLTRRASPDMVFVPRPKPVTAVVDSTSRDAMEAVRGAADAVQAMQTPRLAPRGYISTELRVPPPTVAISRVDEPEPSGSGDMNDFPTDRIASYRPAVKFVSSPEAVQAAFAQASATSPWFSSARLVQAGFGRPVPGSSPWSP